MPCRELRHHEELAIAKVGDAIAKVRDYDAGFGYQLTLGGHDVQQIERIDRGASARDGGAMRGAPDR
jgi:hypothetical protein